MFYFTKWMRLLKYQKKMVLQFLGVLLLLILVLLIFNSINFAQERNWKKFSPANGSWSILSPGAMMPDSYAQKTGSHQGTFSFYDSNSFFAVIYKDYSKLNYLLPWKKAHFTKQRDLVIKRNKGKLLKDEEFTNGDIQGCEVLIQMPDNRVISRESYVKPNHRVQRFRMFFQGFRFYMILAVLPEDEIDSPEVNSYLNSFALNP